MAARKKASKKKATRKKASKKPAGRLAKPKSARTRSLRETSLWEFDDVPTRAVKKRSKSRAKAAPTVPTDVMLRDLVGHLQRAGYEVTGYTPATARKPRAPRTADPLPEQQPRSGKKTGFALLFSGWGLAAGLGVLWLITRSAEPQPAPALPAPPAPPAPPSPPPSTQQPKPPSSNNPQIRLSAEFRRAKAAEIPRDILALTVPFLKSDAPMGGIEFTKDTQGREWALVIEEHVNKNDPNPNLRKPHRGVSVFVREADMSRS